MFYWASPFNKLLVFSGNLNILVNKCEDDNDDNDDSVYHSEVRVKLLVHYYQGILTSSVSILHGAAIRSIQSINSVGLFVSVCGALTVA